MNCFTLEASFHGYITRERTTVEFKADMFSEMGKTTCEALLEYLTLVEEDDRQKEILRIQFRKKKKARDIAKACLRR
jgi:23S rRNA maturation mini-RNase III